MNVKQELIKPENERMYEYDYYVIDRAEDQAYPLISELDGSIHTSEYIYNHNKKRIKKPRQMQFVFGKPVPRKPIIGDYFSQPESIVSARVKRVLESFHLKGVQFVPAVIYGNNNEILDNYYYIHILKQIRAMDMDKSDYKRDANDESFFYIDSLELDKYILKKIPLEKRLVFKLEENLTLNLYHRSVMEAIMAIDPVGVKFMKVAKWGF